VLTNPSSSKHIDDILFMGPKVCNVLTEIEFQYTFVDYDAHNGMCPELLLHLTVIDSLLTRKLQMHVVLQMLVSGNSHRNAQTSKKVSLPGSDLGNDALTHLIHYCKDLTHLELSGRNITAEGFCKLAEYPEWANKLKKLRLEDCSNNKNYMQGL
jgi:hypothetical protein